MYRSKLQSVIDRLLTKVAGRACFPKLCIDFGTLAPAVRQNTDGSRSSLIPLILAAPALVPLALTMLETNKTNCDDPEKGDTSEAAVPLDVRPATETVEKGNNSKATVKEAGDVKNTTTAKAPVDNPLWPSGVSVDMVNGYVDQILADPNINIKTVPDSIERTIYVSTVRLTLNTVYEVVSWLHGMEFLGHRLMLDRTPLEPGDVIRLDLKHNLGKINVDVLDAMADELLQNKAINQRWLPDVIERQIYANCMRIIFTIIDGIADSMAFHMCGHSLSLKFEPMHPEKARELAKRYQCNGFQIDEIALDSLVDQTVRESHEASQPAGIISYLPGYQTFIRTLHKTLCTFFW